MPATIGKALTRKEDLRLLRGAGRYSDDLSLPGQAYAVFLRSPHAHARAAHVAKFDTWVQRVTGVPLDARAAIGVYDPASRRYTLHAGSGGVVRQKNELAGVLGVPPADVRVECGDVGGNFGTRNAF